MGKRRANVEKPKSLRDFIRQQMDMRHMSEREFAKFVGVSPGTINSYLVKTPLPGMEFLIKLSDSTGISLVTVITYAYPLTADRLGIKPEVALMSELLTQLSEEYRGLVYTLLRGLQK